MERIDLSNLSDEQLANRAALARNDHWQYARQSNERGMAASLAEYNRVRIEQAQRHTAQLRMQGASLNAINDAEREELLVITQHRYWSGVAAGPQAVAV